MQLVIEQLRLTEELDALGRISEAPAPVMTRMLTERRLDMVSAARDTPEVAAYRLGHRIGNAVLTGMVRRVFGSGISDLLSGYRVFSRRFVKSFPALTGGFETETEFTVHALTLNMPVAEVRAPYRSRSAGSQSKLRTVSDGFRILREIVQAANPLRARPRGLSLFPGWVHGLPGCRCLAPGAEDPG